MIVLVCQRSGIIPIGLDLVVGPEGEVRLIVPLVHIAGELSSGVLLLLQESQLLLLLQGFDLEVLQREVLLPLPICDRLPLIRRELREPPCLRLGELPL